jgi:hypothetical protein
MKYAAQRFGLFLRAFQVRARATVKLLLTVLIVLGIAVVLIAPNVDLPSTVLPELVVGLLFAVVVLRIRALAPRLMRMLVRTRARSAISALEDHLDVPVRLLLAEFRC